MSGPARAMGASFTMFAQKVANMSLRRVDRKVVQVDFFGENA